VERIHEALQSSSDGSHKLAWWLLRERTSHDAQLDGRVTQLWLVLHHLVSSQPGSGAAASPGHAQGCQCCSRSVCCQELLFSFASSSYSEASLLSLMTAELPVTYQMRSNQLLASTPGLVHLESRQG